jgi:hypothetical protein
LDLGGTSVWQQKNWTELDTNIRAKLTQWEKVPQAASCQEGKQILNQVSDAKLTHVLAVLPRPPHSSTQCIDW